LIKSQLDAMPHVSFHLKARIESVTASSAIEGVHGTTASTCKVGWGSPMPTRTIAKSTNASARFISGPPSMMITRL
jgi:hypothetical protein